MLRPSYLKYYEEVLGLDNPCVASTAIAGSIDTENQTSNVQEQQLAIINILESTPECPENHSFDANIDEESNDQFGHNFSDDEHNDISGSGSHTALRSTPMPTSPLPRQFGSELAERRLSLVTKQPSAGTSNKGKSLAKTPHVAKRSTPAAPIANTSSRSSSAEGITTNSFAPESQSAFEALKRKRESTTLRQTMKKAKFSLCSLGETTANSRLTDQRLRVFASAMTVREMLKELVEKSEIPEDLLDLLYNLEENV